MKPPEAPPWGAARAPAGPLDERERGRRSGPGAARKPGANRAQGGLQGPRPCRSLPILRARPLAYISRYHTHDTSVVDTWVTFFGGLIRQ